MKKIYILLLLAIATTLTAQEWQCPQRVAKGDTLPAQRVEPRMLHMGIDGIGHLTLPPNIPVILVNFSDYAFSTNKAHADSLFNAHEDLITDLGILYNHMLVEHGSVATYFDDQSLGQYRPKFDVVGPVTLSKSYGYYGEGRKASGHASEMIKEACTLVNDSIDFSQYDANGDGTIDLVFVFYAGFGENDRDYIDTAFHIDVDGLVWPHYSTTSGGPFDGKYLGPYECSNELDGFLSQPSFLVPAGSGILVHEYSHGIGLPDVYSNNNQYMGRWDLMDYGCYNMETYVPAPYTGWERWFCGWSQPQWMNRQQDITLHPISTSGDFGVITSDGLPCDSFNTTTYWIIENHQRENWDKYACGEGLILYQLKYHSGWAGNNVNSETNKSYVLLPADGILRQEGFVGKESDCYPYGSLDSITTIAPNYPITTITQEENGDITFKVCGGTSTQLEVISSPDAPTPRKLLYQGTIYIHLDNKLYTITGDETYIL